MTNRSKRLAEAVRLGLIAGAVGVFLCSTQARDAAAAGSTETTGSRIKRAGAASQLPVTVFERADLDRSGHGSVADFLRSTSFNSFGSLRPQAGASAQSNASLSLRGVGADRTLILIAGRRVPVSPSLGSAHDLNSIPLAMVERIEVLMGSASAIYGADAIGGGINLITRTDLNGVEMTLGAGNPTQAGGETEEGSVIFGTTSDRGKVLAGVSYTSRGIVFRDQRDYSRGGQSTFSNNFFTAVPVSNALLGFIPSGFLNNPTHGARVPGANACSAPGFSATDNRCFYDFTRAAADEVELRNSSLFTRASYRINDDWSTYANASISRVKSFGRDGPAPSTTWPGGLPLIPVGSPNHPAIRFPGAGYSSSSPVFLRHRFAAVGNRDNVTDSNVYDFLLGAEGRIGTLMLNFGLRRAEFKHVALGRNYIVSGLGQAAIADGRYDIYDPFGNSRGLLDSISATINRDASSSIEELFASAQTDLWRLAGGATTLSIGGEYRVEQYRDLLDTLQESGQIAGQSVGPDALGERGSSAAERDGAAVFAELLLPVTSQLAVSLASRYDDYRSDRAVADYGSDTSSQLAVRWQPADSLSLRASWGQGFRAPSLDMFGTRPVSTLSTVNDPPSCLAFTITNTCFTQQPTEIIANAHLQSEQSRQWSAGVDWSRSERLAVSIDYYDISIDDRIAAIGAQQLVDCLNGLVPCPAGVNNLDGLLTPDPAAGLGVARRANNQGILFLQRGLVNAGSVRTRGVQMHLSTHLDLARGGQLHSQIQLGHVADFRIDSGPNQVGDPSRPRNRARWESEWTLGDFSLAWAVNHIDSTRSTQAQRIVACDADANCLGTIDYGYSLRLPSWTTHDLQASWSTPWNGRIRLGVHNLANKSPVLDPLEPSGHGFDFNLYDGYGRVPYLRYSQSF